MTRIPGALFIASAAIITFAGAAVAAPVTLSEALARASEASPRIAVAAAQVEAAKGRALQAGVSPNPEVSLEAENFGGTGPFRTFRSTETTLAVSQRFELGGKRSARKAVTRAELDLAQLTLARTQAELTRDIWQAHADLRAAEDRAVIARSNARRARELARTAGILVEAGRDPPLRKLRADALLAEAEAETAKTFGELLGARRLLQTLTGIDDADISAVADVSTPMPPSLPGGEPGIDEKIARAEREASAARLTLARTAAAPDLTASGGVRRFNESDETAFVAGVSVPIPIRDRNRGGIAAAEAEGRGAEAALVLARLENARLRRDAETAVAAADARLAALSGPGLTQAREAVRLAEIGYRAGKFSLIDLIDAQQALNAAELALVEARRDRARALADLARANAR